MDAVRSVVENWKFRMQITLTQSGDYAVRAVLAIARHGRHRLLKAREIAEEMDIPSSYLAQILSSLVHGQVLHAVAGPSGGYRLAVTPETLSLLDVIRVIEGPVERERCVLRGGPCDWEALCPLHPIWHDIEQVTVERLKSTTFDQLVLMDRAIETGAAPIPRESHGRTVPRRGRRLPIDGDATAARGRD